MRGKDVTQGVLFSYVNREDRVPQTHPLRRMRLLVDGILASLSDEFAARYAHTGRPAPLQKWFKHVSEPFGLSPGQAYTLNSRLTKHASVRPPTASIQKSNWRFGNMRITSKPLIVAYAVRID
jgi:hypothetical protein